MGVLTRHQQLSVSEQEILQDLLKDRELQELSSQVELAGACRVSASDGGR